jgi:hypothetical protein
MLPLDPLETFVLRDANGSFAPQFQPFTNFSASLKADGPLRVVSQFEF